MPCNIIKTGDGTVIIMCGRGERNPIKCSYCTRTHTKLCDFKAPIEGGWKVCDKPICDACSIKKGPDVDHCRIHAIRGDKEVL